jgi:hypothetical protein
VAAAAAAAEKAAEKVPAIFRRSLGSTCPYPLPWGVFLLLQALKGLERPAREFPKHDLYFAI